MMKINIFVETFNFWVIF